MSSALAKPELVRADTGEVVSGAVVPFDMATYLSDVKTDQALAQQQALMAAYDRACEALIGPNDIQKEGNRSFKKKSAWRKLARHFGISVQCSESDVRIDRVPDSRAFVVIAAAKSIAPWGQEWSDVGACGSDEATGRRVITLADAIATAMTRASNRAVSNLIAMGEVSAEEMSREPQEAAKPRNLTVEDARTYPFPWKKPVKFAGKPLGDVSGAMLQQVYDWAVKQIAENGENVARLELRQASELLLKEKGVDAATASEKKEEKKPVASDEEFPAALQDQEDDLPF